MQEEKQIKMEVVNSYAAGIDIGSRSHFVAIGQKETDVKEFGVFNEDLFAIAKWLKDSRIKTVAMESTGTYWQALYAVLIAEDFQVILCNGKFTKNIKGKKQMFRIVSGSKNYTALDYLAVVFCPIYKQKN